MGEPGGRGGPGPTLVLIFFFKVNIYTGPSFSKHRPNIGPAGGNLFNCLSVPGSSWSAHTFFPPFLFSFRFFFPRRGAIFFLFIFPPKHAYNTHSTQVITHTAHCWGFRTPFTGLVTTQLRGSPAKAAAAPASPLSSVRSKAVAGRPWEAPARPSVNRLLLFGCSSVQYYHRFTGN